MVFHSLGRRGCILRDWIITRKIFCYLLYSLFRSGVLKENFRVYWKNIQVQSAHFYPEHVNKKILKVQLLKYWNKVEICSLLRSLVSVSYHFYCDFWEFSILREWKRSNLSINFFNIFLLWMLFSHKL